MPRLPAALRRTPPALFPPVLGLFGLGLAWRRGAEIAGLPASIAELMLGAVTFIFLAGLGAYLVKVACRPAVLAEELRVLPGRAGLAAMSISVFLLSAALTPYHAGLATLLLCAGFALHTGLAVLLIAALLSWPAEQRQVTPAWHLSFVGFIVGAAAAVPLGYIALAEIVAVLTLAVAAGIYGVSVAQILRQGPPPLLRPVLAIHLAPFSLFGTVAAALNQPVPMLVFTILAALLLAALLLSWRYLTASGFSPLWGAFTFPFAAFTGLVLIVAGQTGHLVLEVAGLVLLAAASVAIPAIAVRILRMWVRGQLARVTNAAEA